MDNNSGEDIRTIKYGGIKYINNVPRKEINEYVRNLPAEKRSSMAEVTQILEDNGLILLIADDEQSPPCPQ